MLTSFSNQNSLTYGYSIALLSSIILSTTGILIRHLTVTYKLPALILALWRDGFVTFTLLLIIVAFRPTLLRIKRQHIGYLLAYGFVLSIFNALWTISVSLNGASVSTVLAYCSAGFTALLGWWFLKERLSWAKIAAIVLSLAGCVLVAEALSPAAWSSNTLGIITGILSGLCYAVYSLMGRAASQRGLNPWITLLYTFGFATVFLFAYNIPGSALPGAAEKFADFMWLGDSLAGWGILFLLAAGPTLAGFGLYNISLGLLPSSVANLILTTEPAFTAAIAYFLLGERLSKPQITGGMMILAGVLFLRLYEGWLERESKTKSRKAPSPISAN